MSRFFGDVEENKEIKHTNLGDIFMLVLWLGVFIGGSWVSLGGRVCYLYVCLRT